MRRLVLALVLCPLLVLGACLTHDRSGEQMTSVPAAGRPSAAADPGNLPTAAEPTTTLVSRSTPRATGDPYADLAEQLHSRGVQIWFEADLVKRWLEGRASFDQALDRLGQLGRLPGVRGFKVADELGYHDGLTTPAQAREFLRAVRSGLATRSPQAEVLVDVVVPDLGCLAWTDVGSRDCAQAATAKTPAASASAVSSYLHAGLIDRLDVSTSLLDEWTYHKWGLTLASAQQEAWAEIDRLGWQHLTRLQARKALAAAGGYQGSTADAQLDAHTYVDVPVSHGAVGVDIWTWRQEYDGELVGLLDSGLQDNPLWRALLLRHQRGTLLFTHMTPSLLPSSDAARARECDRVAEVFGAVYVAAGTG